MAEIIEKMTPEKFADRFSELMMDQRVYNILVRGYFDDDKVLLTFGILIISKNYLVFVFHQSYPIFVV